MPVLSVVVACPSIAVATTTMRRTRTTGIVATMAGGVVSA